MKNKLLATALMTGFCVSAQALPYLQLDTNPGSYIGGTEQSSIATSNPFTLYGLIDTTAKQQNNLLFDAADDFTISVAILGLSKTVDTTSELLAYGLGSFSIGSTTYDANNLLFGTPPDPTGDLQTHGIYDAWFLEVALPLSTNRLTGYDAQTTNIDPISKLSSTGTLAYGSLLVDITKLNSNLGLHFDFYTTDSAGKIDKFAPFSHDALSGNGGGGGGGGGGGTIPEPGTIALLGLGLLGMGMTRLNKKA